MIVSKDRWLHVVLSMFYHWTGCEDVTVKTWPFNSCILLAWTGTHHSNRFHISHFSGSVILREFFAWQTERFLPLRCDSEKRFVSKTFSACPALWTSRACSRHTLFDDQREVETCKWQHVTAPLAWTTSLEVVLENGPYVAPTLAQEIYAPEEWNLGKQQKTAMASLVGLKVQPLGPSKRWFEGLIVCTLDSGKGWFQGVEVWECCCFKQICGQHWRFGTGWMCSKLNAAAMGALPFVSRDSWLSIADHHFARIEIHQYPDGCWEIN